ncbi:MAG: hypothetical protein AABZ94_06850, partial [Candidatus Eisenbacteria bacterium]
FCAICFILAPGDLRRVGSGGVSAPPRGSPLLRGPLDPVTIDCFAKNAATDFAGIRWQIKELRRQARPAVTLEEQREIHQQLQKLEKQQRRLAQRTETERLFTIQWAVA